MLTKIWDKKVSRYLVVGSCNTLVDIILLNLFVFLLHLPILPANLLAATLSITLSYFLNRRVVFRSSNPYDFKSLAQFFTITGLGIIVIQSVVIMTVVHILSFERGLVIGLTAMLPGLHWTADAVILNTAKISAVLAATCWNFILYKTVVFRAAPANS